MRPRVLALVPLFLFFTPLAHANTDLESLSRNAVSQNAKEAKEAIAELRDRGPAGLTALFQTHAAEIENQIANPLLEPTPEWRQLSAALDAVAQQKDSYLAGLYWYTDLNKARAASLASGKPILSLRLLGKLSEEFSCANSRFFRTILYSNADVSKTLREQFILHWQSERPAPRVTIDFGDGRKLERTLTGNSIHYILDHDAKPIDALPGLYGPGAFLRALNQVRSVFDELEKPTGEKPAMYVLASHQRGSVGAISLKWVTDIQKIGGTIPKDIRVVTNRQGTPYAIEITSLAITKAITEATILRNIIAGREALEPVMNDAAWREIAALHRDDARLDTRSLGLIKRQTRNVLTTDGSVAERDKEFARLVDQLQTHIALDTVRNEYLMHTKVLGWLIADRSRADLELLNKKVYAELFLTPATDPWLGLFSSDTYMALENSGVVR
jgi:hypothetical protein